MRSLILFASFVACFVFAGEAHAWPRRYRATNNNYVSSGNHSEQIVSDNQVISDNNKVVSYTSNIESAGNSDQERCQAEANYMASRGIKNHVWGCIGSFEGIGWGSSPNCNTCTPGRGMRLTGDASAKGADGWYRVRSWR